MMSKQIQASFVNLWRKIIVDSSHQIAPSQAKYQLNLLEQASVGLNTKSSISWISEGLRIQESQ